LILTALLTGFSFAMLVSGADPGFTWQSTGRAHGA
jgi:hypothetical protein